MSWKERFQKKQTFVINLDSLNSIVSKVSKDILEHPSSRFCTSLSFATGSQTMESLALTRGLFTLTGATIQWEPSHEPEAAQASQAANVIIDEEREQNGRSERSRRQIKKKGAL